MKSISPWKLIESKYVVQEPWITLRSDRCQIDENRIIEPFYILESPDFVHCVALNKELEFLLVWQYRHACRKVIAELPGGIADTGEDRMEDVARRELLEETGFSSEKWSHLISSYPNPARQENQVHMFLAEEIEQVQEQSLDEYEDIEFEFVSFAKLKTLIQSGDFANAYHVSAVYLAAERLGLLSF